MHAAIDWFLTVVDEATSPAVTWIRGLVHYGRLQFSRTALAPVVARVRLGRGTGANALRLIDRGFQV